MKTLQEKKIELLAILKKYERQIDDSDYHDVAIFDCDYNRIVDKFITALDKEIEQGGQRKNAEEILNKYPSFCYEPKLKSVLVYIKADIIRAMEEYAQQKCYPEEFVKWVVDDIGWDAYFVDRDECLSTGKDNLKFDELLPYWLTNIKDK